MKKKAILAIVIFALFIGMTAIPMSTALTSKVKKDEVKLLDDVETATLKWAFVSGKGEYLKLEIGSGEVWSSGTASFGPWWGSMYFRPQKGQTLTVFGKATNINGETCNKIIKINIADDQMIDTIGVSQGKCKNQGDLWAFGFNTWHIHEGYNT
jgi:hypothetical protein